MCSEVIDCCRRTGMSEPAVLYIDGDCGEYDNIIVPSNFTVYRRRERAGLSNAMRWYVKNYPDEKYYGLLSDDNFPITSGWDKGLSYAAGAWCMSYANDLHLSHISRALAHLTTGMDMTSAMCWGGDLIRACGWWALPGTRQGGTDVAWCQGIIAPMGLARYCHHILVEHRNHKTGKRERDQIDSDSEEDVELMKTWINSPDANLSRMRIISSLLYRVSGNQ